MLTQHREVWILAVLHVHFTRTAMSNGTLLCVITIETLLCISTTTRRRRVVRNRLKLVLVIWRTQRHPLVAFGHSAIHDDAAQQALLALSNGCADVLHGIASSSSVVGRTLFCWAAAGSSMDRRPAALLSQ